MGTLAQKDAKVHAALEIVKTEPMTDAERQRSFFEDYQNGESASA
jgi:hypothetical protein